MDITRLRTWFKLGTGKCYTESHDSGCSLDRRHWVWIYIDWAGNPNEIFEEPRSKGNATPKNGRKKHHPDHPDHPDRPDRPDCPEHPHTILIQDDPGWPRMTQDRLWRWFCDADPNVWMLIPVTLIRLNIFWSGNYSIQRETSPMITFLLYTFFKSVLPEMMSKYTTKTNVNSRSVVPALAG